MTIALAAMLGQIGLPGGGFGFGYGSMGGRGEPRENIPSVRMNLGKNPTGSFIPVARIADMLLQPNEQYDFNGERRTYPDIRMVYWCGGNPFSPPSGFEPSGEGLAAARNHRRPRPVVGRPRRAMRTSCCPPPRRSSATTSARVRGIRFILAMHKVIRAGGRRPARFRHLLGASPNASGSGAPSPKTASEMEWLGHIYEEARRKGRRPGRGSRHVRAFLGDRAHRSRPAGDAARLSGRFQRRP